MSDIVIEDGVVKYINHKTTKKYSDDTKKDVTSETKLDTVIVFKDKDGVYPDGKIVTSDEFVTMYNYDYKKDSEGNTLSCSVTKSVKKNGKLLDIEKIGSKKYYDKLGRLIKEESLMRDGLVYRTDSYEYDIDNNVIRSKSKGMQTVRTREYFRGEVSRITEMTIKSKMTHTPYRAFFDEAGRIYKVIDGDKHIEIDYERDFNSEGKILSETERFFDIRTTTKKLISYVVTSYVPAADYKIGKVVKNGILTEEHVYNLKGDEISLYKFEDGKELFSRTEKSTDEDTGDVTSITSTRVTDCATGKLEKDKTIKTVYDKDGNLIVYSEDNSMVSTYEYDEDGRRTSVITKKLVDDEFVVINEVKYEYTTDEDTGETTKKRYLTIFDDNGDIISKNIHEEKYDAEFDEFTEEKLFFEKPEDTDDDEDTTTDSSDTDDTKDDTSSSETTEETDPSTDKSEEVDTDSEPKKDVDTSESSTKEETSTTPETTTGTEESETTDPEVKEETEQQSGSEEE